jgi:hypothetical protein
MSSDVVYTGLGQRAAAVVGQVAQWRHHPHHHPELSNRESSSEQLIADRLRSLDLDEVRTGIAGHAYRWDGHPTNRRLEQRLLQEALSTRTSAEAKSIAPKTIMRGAGTEDSTRSVSGAPQREPCSPISRVPVRPASRKAPASAATVRSSSGWAPKPPSWEPSGRTTRARPMTSAGPLTIRATAASPRAAAASAAANTGRTGSSARTASPGCR